MNDKPKPEPQSPLQRIQIRDHGREVMDATVRLADDDALALEQVINQSFRFRAWITRIA